MKILLLNNNSMPGLRMVLPDMSMAKDNGKVWHIIPNSEADRAAAIRQTTETDKAKETWLHAAGLVERMNGLLKVTLKKLNQSDTSFEQWRDNLSDALQIINNRPITDSMTPLMRMLTPNLTIHEAHVVETIIYWKIHEEARIPERATPLSAGLDLGALDVTVIPSGKVVPISTGLGCQIPKGHYGQNATRSSFALKGAIVVGGIIDADYQGEIKVLLLNLGTEPLIIEKKQKMAQMLLIPVNLSLGEEGHAPAELTGRGDKGFGSSDVTNVGAKIWVQNAQGPPSEAEVNASKIDPGHIKRLPSSCVKVGRQAQKTIIIANIRFSPTPVCPSRKRRAWYDALLGGYRAGTGTLNGFDIETLANRMHNAGKNIQDALTIQGQ
ncbi:unnamed protein product [Ranitomeya imitator]|uniref:Deoxyuridine 5'-triphosphate nucleotidohydrolase n=1 Tax=Ranitomeya imitator TaxID=111125 RepID=A0ABN9MJ94_9NEOB|nr:unnamed protein product [Ranitomeya imitator]